jgi:hypothetical protein
LATSTTAAVALKNAGIAAVEEARVLVGLPPNAPGALGTGADMSGTATASPDDPNAPDLPEGESGGDDTGGN